MFVETHTQSLRSDAERSDTLIRRELPEPSDHVAKGDAHFNARRAANWNRQFVSGVMGTKKEKKNLIRARKLCTGDDGAVL